METAVEVKHLSKYFDVPAGTLHAVDDVSFSIEEGTTMGIVGESGCGKSTLGRTIIHLLSPTGGQIFFHGRDITYVEGKDLKKVREKMQIIFQDPYSSLNPRMTISQMVREPLRVSRHLPKAEAEQELDRLMKRVGIEKRLYDAYPHELDGGRRQRVGIARALALNPEFIVCDEPVSALDVSIQAQILNLLMDLQDEDGLTMIFVTHDMSVVRHISDRIGVMYLGQMVEMAETEELFEHPLHPYTKALLSAIPTINIHQPMQRIALKGELTSPIDPKPGCRFAPRCPHACEKCQAAQQLRQIREGHLVSCCRAEELQ